jgi:hypothetical protein
MSRHFTPPPADGAGCQRLSPGAAAVGHLAELDPASGLAVVALRLWCDRGSAALAREIGPEVAGAFARFCGHCLEGARRPLMRHGAGCPCVGADEAAVVTFLRMAAEGEREDALMMALVMLRPEAAAEAVALGQQAGLMLRRLILREARGTVH